MKNIVLTVMVVCVGLVGVCSATENGRILHFPADRSLGKIKVMDANIKRQIQISRYTDSVGYQDWYDWADAEVFSQARGDIVIPAGKKVALFLNKNAFKDLSPLLNLKPDDLYMLSLLPVTWDTNIPLISKSMQHISHLTGLKVLWLSKTTTTAEPMKHITKMQSLEMLYPPKGLTDKGLSYLTQLEFLKRLYFTENKVTNAGLKYSLPKLTKLEELALYSGRMNDAGLEYLAAMPKLAYLSLRSGNFTDDALAHVRKCSSLRVIDLMHLPITDVGLQHLSGHRKLESLLLYNTEVTDRGLVYLKSLSSLKKLNVRKRSQKNQITNAGMVHLAQINSLERLELPGGITDKGIAHVANLKNLKHLWGSGTTDIALQHISKLQSLEYLHTGSTGYTNAGMSHLAKLTNLKTLKLTADSITDEGLAKLKTLKSLERLSLRCENITISGLSHLNVLKNLSNLQLQNIKQNNSGLDISGLTKLEELILRVDAPIHDEDLVCLAKLKNLKLLVIGGGLKSSEVSDAGIAHLKDLPNMRELHCRSPYLTDKSLFYLANMKTLTSLTITGNFTDAGLKFLENLPALRSLELTSDVAFSNTAIQRLQNKRPNIYLKIMP